jgi:translation initiation factor IF-3
LPLSPPGRPARSSEWAEPGFVVTAAPAVDRWRTSRVRHLRVLSRSPGRIDAGATDPVQQRYQRGDHIATDDARINDRIRAREVLLIGAGGEQLGVKPLPEALTIAREEELDLVEVAPNANPPVCRIMNYGRYKYEQEQRRKESRKKATNVVVKEMKFRPKIDEHDYVTKMKHVERFLAEGSKVKLTIMFRGREVFHPELGLRILERVAEQVSEIAIVESAPRQDGRNMTMVLHPIKRPAKARAAAAPPPPTGNGSEGEQ